MNRNPSLFLNDICDIDGEAAPHLVQYLCDLTLADEHIANVFVIGDRQAQAFTDSLECVAERTMPEIMNERCSQSAVLTTFGSPARSPNDIHQLSRSVVYANTMSQT